MSHGKQERSSANIRGAQFAPLTDSSRSPVRVVSDRLSSRRTRSVSPTSCSIGNAHGQAVGKHHFVSTLLRRTPTIVSPSSRKLSSTSDKRQRTKFRQLLTQPTIPFARLRKISWSGVYPEYRALVWLLLARVLPLDIDRHESVLKKRVNSYLQQVRSQYNITQSGRISQAQAKCLHQIRLDIPRTNPRCRVVQHPKIQEMLERILYIWAVRNPAVSYVQGFNDLCTPLLYVFLANQFQGIHEDVDVTLLSEQVLCEIETSTFYVLSRIFDDIQENYIFAQPGIQRMLYRLEELIKRIDESFHNHLKAEGVQYVQFAFRWMNCFLIREIALEHVVRLWDSYFATDNGTGFSEFHIYVCAALLMRYADKLKELEFQDLVLFLHNMPTGQLGTREIDSILSQAFIYESLFANSQAHLQQ